MTQLDGPSDDGLLPPDKEALFVAQRKAEIMSEVVGATIDPARPDPDASLEQRRADMKAAAKKAVTEPPELTDTEETEVVDLIHAGRKESWPVVFGRKIHLRTLTIEEELKVSEITKPYIGTDAYARSYRTAVVAAAIRTIDGELLFNPLSESEFENLIAEKFKKLLDWYPLGVDQVYARYRDMELELLALVEKLGKSSG